MVKTNFFQKSGEIIANCSRNAVRFGWGTNAASLVKTGVYIYGGPRGRLRSKKWRIDEPRRARRWRLRRRGRRGGPREERVQFAIRNAIYTMYTAISHSPFLFDNKHLIALANLHILGELFNVSLSISYVTDSDLSVEKMGRFTKISVGWGHRTYVFFKALQKKHHYRIL